jgi:dTDP-4-amino-4,6-dideoxygalactose transaminase
MTDSDSETTVPPASASGRQRRLLSPIPFVDLATQHRALERPLREAISRLLETSGFILGEDVAAFEEEFAAFCGVKHAIGVASGLDALTLSVRALGVKNGQEVILPANTFIATALAVAQAGARPVLVDVDPETYNMDPALVEKAINKKTKALMPVHLYGQSADMNPLRDLARKHGLVMIEDSCQAHGALYKGRNDEQEKCGGMSDAGCFSFYPSKNLGALGDGGMITTNRDDLAEDIRTLRHYGQTGKNVHSVKGINSRLDALQAVVLRVKLRQLPKWNEARRRHAAHYQQTLEDSPVATPIEKEGNMHVYHLYVVRVPKRDELLAHLEALGISCGVHYPIPIHLQEAFSDLGKGAGSFPVTERLASEILSLPMYPEMADSSVDTISDTISAFFSSQPTRSGVTVSP